MEPITNEEVYLSAMSGESVSLPEPITRKEVFLAAAAGMAVSVPDPITREEMFLSQIKPGDGSGVVIRNQNKTITENGTYKADSGYTGLGTVTVAVPIPEVEAPILTDITITENGEYTPGEGVYGFNRVTVEVEGSGGGSGGISAVKFMDEDITIEESTSTAVTYTIDGAQIPTLVENLTIWNCFKGSEVYLFFIKQKEATGEYTGTEYITKSAMFAVYGHTNYGATLVSAGANKGTSSSVQKHGGGFSQVSISGATGVTNDRVIAPIVITVKTNAGYVAQAGIYNVQGWMLTDFDWGF